MRQRKSTRVHVRSVNEAIVVLLYCVSFTASGVQSDSRELLIGLVVSLVLTRLDVT